MSIPAQPQLPPTQLVADVVGVGAVSTLAAGGLELAMQLRCLRRTPSRRLGPAVLAVGLDEGIPYAERLRALATAALREAHDGRFEAPVPVVLTLPERYPRLDKETAARLFPVLAEEDAAELRAIAEAAGVAIDTERSRVLRGSGATGAAGFEVALQLLQAGSAAEVPAVLVGGADSPATKPRGRGEGERTGGLYLGEAGAFVALARPDRDARPAHASMVAAATEVTNEDRADWRIRRDAFAAVQRRGGTARALIAAKYGISEGAIDDRLMRRRSDGRALAMLFAVERLLGVVGGKERLAWVWSDVAESYELLRQWRDVTTDVGPLRVEQTEPARQLGRLGCANAALALTVASWWWAAGCAPAPELLIALHDDGPLRAALLARQVPQEQDAGRTSRAAPRDPERLRVVLDVTRNLCEAFVVDCKTSDRAAGSRSLLPAAEGLLARLARIRELPVTSQQRLEVLDELGRSLTEVRGALAASGKAQEGIGGSYLSRLDHMAEQLEKSRPMMIAAIDLRASPGTGEPDGECGFRASRGVARRHRLVLPPLSALVEDPLASSVSPMLQDTDDQSWRTQAAWAHFDNLSGLVRTRSAGAWAGWSPALADFDDQLLAEIDALASLDAATGRGSPMSRAAVLAELCRYAPPRHADADRAFMRALLLCTSDREEGPRRAVLALRQSPPVTWRAQLAALALAPADSPVAEALADLVNDSDPRLVRLAIDVLARRGQATAASLLLLAKHPDIGVCDSVAIALGGAPEHEAARSTLRAMLQEGPDDRVAATVAASLSRLRDATGLSYVRTRLSEEAALPGLLGSIAKRRMVMLTAYAGGASDLELLRQVTSDSADLIALGWLGDLRAVPRLIEVLESDLGCPLDGDGESLGEVAARALQLLTDAMPVVPFSMRGRRPDAVTASPDRWRRWWQSEGRQLDCRLKHRRGKPFTPAAVIDELRRPFSVADTRVDAYRELWVLAGPVRLPHHETWIARQLEELAALHRYLQPEAGSVRVPHPGSWPSSWLRQRGWLGDTERGS